MSSQQRQTEVCSIQPMCLSTVVDKHFRILPVSEIFHKENCFRGSNSAGLYNLIYSVVKDLSCCFKIKTHLHVWWKCVKTNRFEIKGIDSHEELLEFIHLWNNLSHLIDISFQNQRQSCVLCGCKIHWFGSNKILI